MVNLLLICDELGSIQNLINKIIMTNNQLRLFNISSSIENSLRLIKENSNIDIIMTYLSKDDTFNFLNNLEKEDICKFQNSVIVITKEQFDLHVKDEICINSIALKDDFNSVIEKIDNLIKLKEENRRFSNYKMLVITYLSQLGYNFSHLGTIYLLDILMILLKNKIKKCPKLEKEIYPIIAKKYSTTVHNVKCTITLATKYMNLYRKDCEMTRKSNILCDDYITTKNVINGFLIKKHPP